MANTKSKDKDFEQVRAYSKRIRTIELNFNSSHLTSASYYYIGWIDIMGSGHIMSTSVQKSANFLARLHIATERARRDLKFSGYILPINDGIFIASKTKFDICSMIGRVMILLAANFIAIPRPHDRFLLRGGIAYGPTYFGSDLTVGLFPKKLRDNASFLDRVMFGPAIIQSYMIETTAPPYGIAIHESARAFSPANEQPFRMNHWMWWAPNEPVNYPTRRPPLTSLKDCLANELDLHFTWLMETILYHGLTELKIQDWRRNCKAYFNIG